MSSLSPGILAARRLAPGLLLSLLVGALTVGLAQLVPAASPALVAIVLGSLLAHAGALPETLAPGITVSSRTVLRLGIVLLGLQLAIGDVIALGPATVLVIVLVVSIGIGSGLAIGRALRVPTPLVILIACGFSICGAAAVAAASGALSSSSAARGADDEDSSQLETHSATAIALVVVVGTVMIPLLPLAAASLGMGPSSSGTWVGASILEVAQVVAAGSLLGPAALDAAVLVKLGRVLMLAPVIALLLLSLRSRQDGGPRADGRAGPSLVPLFVVGFLLAVALRSTGLLPDPVLDAAARIQPVLLAAAMFALGTGVRVALLRRIGGRPVVLALLLGAVVTVLGLGGACLAG